MPSGHSSSSHSSFGGGSSFSGGFSSPSFHSSSSHSSWGSSSSSSSSYHSSSSLHSSAPKNYEPKHYAPTPSEIHRNDYININQMLWYYYMFQSAMDNSIRYRYKYYPKPFTDKNGMDNKAGYYDEETGKRYDNLIMPGVKNVVTCPSCNKQFFHTWETSGTKAEELTCPFCKYPIQVSHTAEGQLVTEKTKLTPEARKDKIIGGLEDFWDEVGKFLVLIVLVVGIFVGIGFGLISASEKYGWGWSLSPEKIHSSIEVSRPNTNVIYVEPIGREVHFDGENYYDPESNMYFWYNTNVSPAQWQYWYGPISEQYGDYGWMEYDTEKGQWFIETYSGNWVVYEGDTSMLWHFENAYQAPSTMAVEVNPADESDLVLITDHVSFYGLSTSKTYCITTTVSDRNTGEVILVQKTEIEPNISEGSVDIPIYVPKNAGQLNIQEEVAPV